MNTTPIHGPALTKALKDQRSTKEEPHLPSRWIKPALAVYVALAAAAAYLAIDAGPLAPYRWHLGLALAVLGALLGMATPAGRRAFRRFTSFALLLALCLGAPALAAERAVYGSPQPRGLVSQELGLGAYVDLGVGAGVDVCAGRATMGVQALGTVALYELAPRWLLGAALGGSLLLGDAGLSGAGFLGGSLSLPAPPGPVMPAVYLGASYHLDGGWGFGGGLLLQI